MIGRLTAPSAIALAILGALAVPEAVSQEVVCLRDDQGRLVGCGDSFTPEQSIHDREIRNEQGIPIRIEQGEITPEERAAIEAAARAEEERIRLALEKARRDQVLLDTFVSVRDIERMRDRRLELLNSTARFTEIYLTNAERRLGRLLDDAQRFAPHSVREDAPPIPENLQLDIDRTRSTIAFRRQQLVEIQESQKEISEKFDEDILRFRELKEN